MNLQDLAKKTIEEVSKEVSSKEPSAQKELDDEVAFEIARTKLAENERIDEHLNDEVVYKDLKDEATHLNSYEKNLNQYPQEQSFKNHEINTQETQPVKSEPLNFNEELFLKNLRERILVLFEGLKSTKEEDLKARLELSTNFLEFLLANIEDKLKK